MDDRELAAILNASLDGMAAGENLTACLARYPEQATALEPMLAAAIDLRALGSHSLGTQARLRAKARLRAAQARQRSSVSARPFLVGWWPSRGALAAPGVLAGLAVALCLLVISVGIVAASQPGDLAYGLRVAADRIPARLASSPEARAQAELAVADRRLEDLQHSLERAQRVDDRAIEALLASEEAAAETALSLWPSVQAQIAAHIEDQGQRLEQLSLAALQAPTADALRAAAKRAYQAARHAHPGAMPPAETPTPPLPGKTKSPSPVLEAMPTHVRAPVVTASFTSTETPRSTAPSRKAEPTRQPAASTATAGEGERQPRMTATSRSTALPGSTITTSGASPTPKVPVVGPATTPSGPGPGPEATSPGPGPEPASPGPAPGPRGEPASPGPRAGSG